jgi:hypothetical protein
MAAELVLAPEAEQDIADAYAWYESRRVGLGEEFLSSVDVRLRVNLGESASEVYVHFDREPIQRLREIRIPVEPPIPVE